MTRVISILFPLLRAVSRLFGMIPVERTISRILTVYEGDGGYGDLMSTELVVFWSDMEAKKRCVI